MEFLHSFLRRHLAGLVESNFPHGMTNQKHYADLGSDASSVWNFLLVSQTSFGGDTIGRVDKNVDCFLRLVFAISAVQCTVYLLG